MKIRERLKFANVVSVVALIVALAGTGGAAYALGKNTVGSPQIKNGQVKDQDLGKNSVTPKKIKKNAVTGVKVKNGSIRANDLNGKTRAGLAEAGVNVNFDGALNTWFNRMGGGPGVTHTSVGSYTITFPGTQATDDSVITVANAAGGSFAHCEVWDVNPNGSVDVRCRNTSTDTLVDSDFSMILFKS